MEDKHQEEMDREKKTLMDGKEVEMKQKMDEVNKEHQSDVDVLLKERELLLEQAEGRRQDLIIWRVGKCVDAIRALARILNLPLIFERVACPKFPKIIQNGLELFKMV